MLYTHEARSPLSIRVQTTPNHCGFFLTTMEAQSPSSIRVKITLNHCGFNHNGGTEYDVNKNTDHAKSLWFS